MVENEHLDSKCQANVYVEFDYSTFVGHFEPVALVVLLVTLLVVDSSVDEATFEALDSFVVIIVGKELCTEDYFHVAVWQVLVLSSVNMLVLVVERPLVQLPFDFRSSEAFHVPFDEAFVPDCDPVEFDDSPGSLADFPSLIDAGLH